MSFSFSSNANNNPGPASTSSTSTPSLFGTFPPIMTTPGTATTTGPSLFGNNTADSLRGRLSMFGRGTETGTATTTGPSLFGNTGGAASSQAQSNPQTTTAPSPSLFGNSTAPPPKPAYNLPPGTNLQTTTGPSLFGMTVSEAPGAGGAQATMATMATTTGPSLFGNMTSQAQTGTATTSGPSLFSQPQQTTQTTSGPSLFGNSTATGTTSSIFGKPKAGPSPLGQSNPLSPLSTGNESKPENKPNMFGGLNWGASTAGGTSTLDGDKGKQPVGFTGLKPLGGGGFGGGGGGNTGGGSTFGGTTGDGGGAGTSSTTETGLFGSTRPGEGLLGPQSFGGSTLRGSTTQSQQSRQQEPDTAYHSGYFNSLLEKGKKRWKPLKEDDVEGLDEIPSLQLGLGDIASKVRQLGGQGPHKRSTANANAHYLLAASGVTPGNTLRDLRSFKDSAASLYSVQQPSEWDPDTHKYVEQLQQRTTQKMIAEGFERAQNSFNAYLEESVDINWEEQRKKIYEHFGLIPKGADRLADSTYLTPGGKGGFGRSSRRGFSERPPTASIGRSMFGKQSLQKSVIGSPGVGSGNAMLFSDAEDKNNNEKLPTQDSRFLRERQAKYAEKIQALNRARLEEAGYPLLHEFAATEGEPGGDTPAAIGDAYKALIHIIGEVSDTRPGDFNYVPERRFAEMYLDERTNSPNNMEIKKKILNGSRKALEQHFLSSVEALIAKNPKEAHIGGVPTKINKIRAYIKLRNHHKNLKPENIELQRVNEDYCWALIFFLLRAGLVKEAADYVTTHSDTFRNLDRNFITYITRYASDEDRRLPRQPQDRINVEYMQRTRIAPHSADPYRMACYKLVGRCELSKRTLDDINQGVDDWIWLQFALAREVNRAEEVAGEVFGLDEVRETIREIGQKHFQRGSEGLGGYGMYFYLQVLGGMFEQAVAYLYSFSYVAAVHIAIALDYYGLLRVSQFSTTSENELLTFTTSEFPQVNFDRMLGFYTRDFRTGNPEAAVDYLALLCLNADLPGDIGKGHASLCHEALRELVLETREFALLLGDIRSDGTRIRGAIEQRLRIIRLADQEQFLRTVTLQAASVADDNGRITDAVLLYHLAEDYDNVVTIISRALSDMIAVDIGQEDTASRLQPLKPRITDSDKGKAIVENTDTSSLSLMSCTDPADLARNMISLYNNNALYFAKIQASNRQACGVLLRISEAKQRVLNGEWPEALDIISSLNLLPLNARGQIPLIRGAAQTLATLPPAISRLIGPLLLWTITCISRQREILLGASPEDLPRGVKTVGGFGDERLYPSLGTNGGGGRGGGGGGGGGIFESETRRAMREELVGKARDLMVFAGLIKLRLGKGVWEGIVGGASDLGVY